MTVSMLTTRLSEVMTGCGGKLTTCSRRSTVARGRSMNGTRKCSPAPRVFWYLPSRSMITAVACWTIRTARSTVVTATTTSRIRTMVSRTWAKSTAQCSVSVGTAPGGGASARTEGGRPVDADDDDVGAGGQPVAALGGARAPGLARELDLPAAVVDLGEGERAPPGQGVDVGGGVGDGAVDGPLDVRPGHEQARGC